MLRLADAAAAQAFTWAALWALGLFVFSSGPDAGFGRFFIFWGFVPPTLCWAIYRLSRLGRPAEGRARRILAEYFAWVAIWILGLMAFISLRAGGEDAALVLSLAATIFGPPFAVWLGYRLIRVFVRRAA